MDINDKYITNYYKTIGSNLKKLRVSKGLTQIQLSQAMNLKSVGLISQSELYLNKQHLNLKHLYIVASILDCKIEDFFEGVDIAKVEELFD